MPGGGLVLTPPMRHRWRSAPDLPMQAYYRQRQDRPVIDRYLSTASACAMAAMPRALRARDIRLILVREPDFIAGLDAFPWSRGAAFADLDALPVPPGGAVGGALNIVTA